MAVSGIAALSILGACKTTDVVDTPASMAVRYGTVVNPGNLNVRVSLGNRAVYVFEGDEPRFVAAVAIGKPSNPTPTGSFKIQSKEFKKRSSGYGFFVKGDEVIPGKRSDMPSGYRYVGYPLPYWPTSLRTADSTPARSGRSHALTGASDFTKRLPTISFT